MNRHRRRQQRIASIPPAVAWMLSVSILAGSRRWSCRWIASAFTPWHTVPFGAPRPLGARQPSIPSCRYHYTGSRRRSIGRSISLASNAGGYHGNSNDVEVIADGIVMGTKINHEEENFSTSGPDAMVPGSYGTDSDESDVSGSVDSIVDGDEASDTILVEGEGVDSGEVSFDDGDLVVTRNRGDRPSPSSSSTDIKQLRKQLEAELREYRIKQSKPINKPHQLTGL